MNHVRVWYVPRLRCLTGVSVGGRQETMIEAIDGEMDTATAKLNQVPPPLPFAAHTKRERKRKRERVCVRER